MNESFAPGMFGLGIFGGLCAAAAQVKSKRARLIWEAIEKDGKPMWKLVGWENVKKSSELPQEYLDGEYNRFYERLAGLHPLSVFVRSGDGEKLDLVDIHTFHTVVLFKDDIYTPEQRAAIERTMERAGKRLAKINREKREAERKAQTAGAAGDGENLNVTVTVGKYSATMLWKRKGEGYRFRGVSGNIEKIQEDVLQNDSTVALCSDGDLGMKGFNGNTYCHPDTEYTPYRYRICCAIFRIACVECFNTLITNEESETSKALKAHLAKGRETFEV